MDERPTTADAVRAAEDRLRTDRKHSNELIGVKLCEAASASTPKSAPAVLAAVQACRGALPELGGGRRASAEAGRGRRGRCCRRRGRCARCLPCLAARLSPVGALRDLLSSAKAPLALRMTALDTLFILASIEAKHAKRHKGIAFHPAALEAAGGAFRAALNALATSRRAPPEELLTRLRDEHIAPHLDAQFYLLRHVKRLADQRAPTTPPPPDRILALHGDPHRKGRRAARRVVPFSLGGGGWTVRAAARSASARAATACRPTPCPRAEAPPRPLLQGVAAVLEILICRCSTTASGHCRNAAARAAAAMYCDLLSDGYAKGGVEALLALKGLFVLMTQYNLEYPKFYPRLYNLLTAEALSGPNRASFAMEARRFLSSSGLPAYLLAAFADASPACQRHPIRRCTRLRSCSTCCSTRPRVCSSIESRRATTGRRMGRAGRGGDDDDDEEEEAAAQEEEEEERTDVDDSTPEALLSAAVTADPFVAEEEDPEKCNALNSSLWEIDQLRQHVCPTVASLASLFAAPMTATTPPIEIEPLAALTYQSLGQLETRKKLRGVPLATRAPRGLLADPIDSSLPGASSVKLTAGLGSWA